MTTTRYSYHKPEGGEATVRTKTMTSVLNAKEATNTFVDQDRQRPSTLTNETESWKSKLGSSSLIRKISNEHFEKAQRKFSGGEEAATNGEPRRTSFESKSESQHKIFASEECGEKLSVDESGASRLYDFDRSSPGYEQESKSGTQNLGRHDSFKDIKNKFQQATGTYPDW